MEEIWKDIPLFEGYYQISNLGNLKSFVARRNKQENGTLIRVKPDKDGYRRCILYGNNIKLIIQIHRLVAELFIDNPDKKPCVNHKDFNRANCAASNLEWVTFKENSQYSKNNLFLNDKRRGQIHPRSLFTNKQVIEMRKFKDNGMSYADIARRYNAKQNTILQIFRRGYYLKIN